MKSGTILVWLGVTIAMIGLLLSAYQVLTCSFGNPGTCLLAPFALIFLIGIVIAVIGFVVRYRHRREVASEKEP